ncbi:MAG: glutamate--tRNA ligase family protein, partial [Patescibacteria group bacterium]
RYVIRLDVPETGVTNFIDVVRGEISFENTLIDDQVLLKSDGYPTYHLGVVVDDHFMNISHIIRGEEWISSTPKHILLYKFFGWDLPVFAHVSLLRNPDKSKLSKRKNPVWASWYKDEGYLPEAVRNYLATMAWAFPDGRDIFSTDEMIAAFTLERLQTTAPVFSLEKLRWMNGEYLRSYQLSAISQKLYEFYGKKYPLEMIEKIWPLVRDRMKTMKEFESLAGFFFMAPKEYEIEVQKELLELVRNALISCEWNHDAMETSIRKEADSKGQKPKDVFMTLRVAVTGKTVGPPLLESLELLGKDKTLSRLVI